MTQTFKIGSPCYALYCGPKREKEPRWVPATVTKVFSSRSFNVRVSPKEVTWRRHLQQLRSRYSFQEDDDPGESSNSSLEGTDLDTLSDQGMLIEVLPLQTPQEPSNAEPGPPPKPTPRNPRLPTGNDYGPGHPRRSSRIRT